MSEKKQTYFHDRQLDLMAIAANKEYVVAPRGWGKSEGIDAPRTIRNVLAMPRSCGALLSPTYGKLLRNTLPAVCRALERLGYKRNIHYFVGKKADKKMNFKLPHTEPFDWEYTIHWFNGSVQHLISFDRPMSANSMSLDYIMGFEAKFLNYDKIKSEVLPANRGNIDLYGSCPWHHGQIFTTDMPTSKLGSWIFDKEKDNDTELIDLIRSLYKETKRLEREGINPQRAKKLREELNFFRSKATLYHEADPIDNIDLLREQFFRDMKRDLPPFLYRTSILNQRIRKLENGFYSALNEKVHYYDNYNNGYLETLNYDFDKAVETDCRQDGDMVWDKPLYITLDYNANINWLVVSQPDYDSNIHRTLKSFFVKGEKRVHALLTIFHTYYQIRSNRDVIYYFNQTALQGAYAISGETFSDFVIKTLSDFGWSINSVYMGQAFNHQVKHRYINDALKGVNYLMPQFNRDNNEELIAAMEQTGVRVGENGFKKDKSGEKLAETPEDQLEFRTDGTDAWDDNFLGCTLHPREFAMGGTPSSLGNR